MKPSTATSNCETYQASLADFVRLELSGQQAEPAYPEIAFHLETCETCETAYYREFRAQGQRKTVAELQQVGDRAQVETIMQYILPPAPPKL